MGEAVLSALLTVLIFIVMGRDVLHARLCSLRSDLMIIVGITLGVSATVWVGFFALLASEFGDWLRKKKEASPYAVALASPIFADLLGFLILLFAACATSSFLLTLTVFVLTYDLVNFITMIRNVIGLIGLWQDHAMG
ncbi:MAG: hypothetical protein ACLPVW_07305 [Terriglobales bacterium]